MIGYVKKKINKILTKVYGRDYYFLNYESNLKLHKIIAIKKLD